MRYRRSCQANQSASSVRAVDEVARAHESIEVTGLHLAAGHNLLDRRKLEDDAEDGGHGAMAGEGLIVKNEVLEQAALNGHEHRAVSGGDGGEDALITRLERDSVVGTGTDANTATEAEGLVDAGLLALGFMRVAG